MRFSFLISIVLSWMLLLAASGLAFTDSLDIGITSAGDMYNNAEKLSMEQLATHIKAVSPGIDSSLWTLKVQNPVRVDTLKNVLEEFSRNGVQHVTVDTADSPPWGTMLKVDVAFDKAAYQLGETIEMTVTVANPSAPPVSLKQLELDRQCLTLNLKTGSMEKARPWTRLHGEWEMTAPAPGAKAPSVRFKEAVFKTMELGSGKTASFSIRFPALSQGTWQWSADFAGLLNSDEVLSSKLSTYTVTSANEKKKAVVELRTTQGTIYTELLVTECPGTAMNFASSVVDGKYDGLIFHRVISGFMIQGGDPDGNGGGSFGYSIPFEKPISKHLPGVLSMARSTHFDSAGSQFFLMHKKYPSLDGLYCVFGKTVQGQDIVDKIAAVSVNKKKRPLEEQKIEKAKIVTWPLQK